MGDYAPIHSGSQSTGTTSAAVTGGRMLVISGDGTVAESAGADEGWLGVAGFDAANGAEVTIEHGGTQAPLASGAITAGDQVITAAGGRVAALAPAATATVADINAARQIVGVARTTAADGEAVEIQMER